MKKFLSLITGLVASSTVFGLAVLNPAAPALLTDGVFFADDCSCWALKVGYRGDFVYDRYVRDNNGNTFRPFQMWTNAGVLTLNLFDRIDIYGFVGASNHNFTSYGEGTVGSTDVTQQLTANSQTTTSWGVGIKAVLFECGWGPNCGTTYLGLDAQYANFGRPSLYQATLVRSDEAIDIFLPAGYGYQPREWQVALGISHKIGFMVPYVAIKWSSLTASIFGDLTSIHDASVSADYNSLRSRRNFGYVIGVSLVDIGRMSLTAEARFGDEKAAAVGAEFRF